MKYVDEFRDGGLARGLAAAIARAAVSGRVYRFMEFCGGHTHAIARYGLEDLLPANVQLIHGPGCPVCVLPGGRLQMAIELAERPRLILASYGDMLRVPVAGDSLLKARARGADVRMVYAVDEALALARRHPEREVVFFAIGFETTTPPTAVAIRRARAEGLGNFSVFCNHVLTPAAIAAILAAPDAAVRLDGFIGPAHVSTVIGSRPYEACAAAHAKALVIAGFEPLDVLQAVLMLVRQVNSGRAEVENEFTRAVSRDGNLRAQQLVAEVFTPRAHFEWRGLGRLAHSALAIAPQWADFDAEVRFSLSERVLCDHKACECAAVLRGQRRPQDCKVFGTACTPENPLGSCMVSSEGACAAHYSYGRFRDRTTQGESA
ncbi:hydrogenase formation protein HypD [Plasticicumulans acidivorans]|uniref:Hydrogenase maturation factor n=1 Tax=Plasticicumulans acidivorans TaxID=886464 RepID=A0A317MZK8_9GAMM|nr:hydrogenase formation protein HypD [Plasticicumulans acidivorans]PWV64722.1 hydrogenase expression/formation protein HypD [Plasticicumulans acidivorans]